MLRKARWRGVLWKEGMGGRGEKSKPGKRMRHTVARAGLLLEDII